MMHILDQVKLVGDKYNGKEGVLTGINNRTASVVIRHEIEGKLYGYIRIEVDVNDIEPIL
jgi:hypothetical protein